ncbi:MAG TPA: dienelactone hydrolase family protein [Kofleriaceae bacterium]|nr:dienelactone hydrolase family protein [Kofleriaceae bacterium]
MTAIEAATSDGTAKGELLVPVGAGPFPLVVFYPDAGGLRAAMVDLAAQLTAAGYAALVVDPYWRHGDFTPFDARTVFTDPPERARLMAMVATVVPATIASDTDALVAAIADPRVRTDRLGAVGYCMGGRLAFLLAQRWPERVVAAAPIHAGGLVTDKPDSPHLGVDRIRAALYLGVADDDSSCTPAHQGALATALATAHVRYTLELYAGARHGFAVPDFAVHDPAAAAHHHARVVALFRDHLAAA